MATIEMVEDMQRRLAEARGQYDALMLDIEETRRAIAAFEYVLGVYQHEQASDVRRQGIHSHIEPSQLADCNTQAEAWERVAKMSGGVARPSDGAQLLIDAGLSSGKRRSLVSSATTYMLDSDNWEWVNSGTYRWVADEEPTNAEELMAGMKAWFLQHYEDPAHEVPHENGYQWIGMGPHDAGEVLFDEFGDTVPEDLILQAARELEQQEGIHEWAESR